SGFLREVVGQLVVHELRPAIRDRFLRLPERIVLVAAAANRPDGAAIGEDEHLRADALRRGAGGGDDGDERRRLAAIERVGDGGEYFAIHCRDYTRPVRLVGLVRLVRLVGKSTE